MFQGLRVSKVSDTYFIDETRCFRVSRFQGFRGFRLEEVSNVINITGT